MQIQDYALGQMEFKTNLGYVKNGCGTSAASTHFSVIGKERALIIAFAIIATCGIFFQIANVWIVSAVLLKVSFKEYLQKTFTYSYDIYGMFWGTSTTDVVLLGVLCGITTAASFAHFTNIKNLNVTGWSGLYVLLVVLVVIPVMELSVATYTATKSTVAVPSIFTYPATLLCCGRKRLAIAECFVTTLTLWVDLVALLLVLLQANLIMFALSAAPFAVITNVMLVALALTCNCLANIFSLLFTMSAHLCTPADQRVHSSSMVLRAVVVLPLLFMIMCYGVVLASMGSVTNMDAKKNNIISFINSAATPILLGMVGIFLNRFISTWLKWSP